MKKLLLHICCGPCSVAIFEELQKQFDLTVHFFNPNIHPEEEYEKRKKEVIKLCNELSIPFVQEEYLPNEWFKLTEEYKDEPEGGKRCPHCFYMRLEKAATYAKKHGFTSLQDFIKNTVRERLFGEDFSEEEKILIKKLIKACDEKGLWSTEEELFAKLEKKCK